MQEPKGKTPVYRDEDVRQGQTILNTRWKRALFIAGMAGLVVLAIAAAIFLRP
jgi:hypothetical protein